ncbi:MAG: acetyl-CoA carboxylase, carboxyltransferase subunit beta [Armatimonadota bacterium]|nr:acetyl-CoA carboxylase, carboxyltransferase subunit beta [Armatimonadota bacterium]MDR7404815.1 acetyl-CoA carboxylase, carboxyltransferase subunit beta [Armatimonadota bacterium]
MLNWLRRPKYGSLQRREMPAGLWARCPRCQKLVYRKELERHLRVCPRCGYHHRLSAAERLEITLDPGSFREYDAGLTSTDPLAFEGYAAKLADARARTGRAEAVLTGEGTIEGWRAVVGALDFFFMGGSMGSAVGEKVARAAERARESRLPLIIFSASGGARMQEGVLSLMQLAKTGAAVGRLHDAGIPYISVLCDPTTGGVTASFAFLGDVILAEPGALIGFAGRRVIEQTIRRRLPDDFQTAEFCLQKGLIDMVVPRAEMRSTLARLLSFFGAPRAAPPEPAPAPP